MGKIMNMLMDKRWKRGLLPLVAWVSLLPLGLHAQAPEEGRQWNEMTGEKMQVLSLKGDPVAGESAFEVCVGCHRTGAVGRVSGAYPSLAGQHITVLIKQIADIRAGLRYNPKMAPFIGEHVVTPKQIADIAVYLNGLPISPDNGIGPGNDLKRGKAMYAKDCATCHGDAGEGSAEQFYPKVAGQHYKYLLREVHMIGSGERANAKPEMQKLIRGYNEADMAAVSDYMSRLLMK